ncbi:hypothetical protein ACERII_11565 [Evansella sp. AB-rgal1]
MGKFIPLIPYLNNLKAVTKNDYINKYSHFLTGYLTEVLPLGPTGFLNQM